VLAFLAGYAQESLRVAFQIWLVGAVLASALCLFGWPWLRRHPVAWLPSVDAPIPPEDEAGAGDGGDAAAPHRVADRPERVYESRNRPRPAAAARGEARK
jgi:hypothetical protein